MTPASVGVARGILRNASALFLVGLFAKAAGLVVAVLVARFLGPGAMGLFALMFSVVFIVEILVSVGTSDSLVRDVAARPSEGRSLYASTLKLVFRSSLACAAVMAGSAWIFMDAGPARNCLLVIAAGAPVSGAFVVSQAVLQGLERVEFLVWVNFIARVVSVILLATAFLYGAGVEAAFASHVLFQAFALAIFYLWLRRNLPPVTGEISTRHLLLRSAPFAVSRLLRILGIRLPSLVLPAAVGLTTAGVFDAANRFSSTLGMATSTSIVGLMPSFARSLGSETQRSGDLVAYSVKYMGLGMAAISTFVALLSHLIIGLFFGIPFAEAALPLQILAWAQVLFAMDAVLQQAMLARGAAAAVIRHTIVGLITQFSLILFLVSSLGLPGVAFAVLLAWAVVLALDLHFVVRRIAAFPIARFALAPLAAVVLVATALHLAAGLPFAARILVVAIGWALAILALRLMPKDEFRFIRELILRRRVDSAGKA